MARYFDVHPDNPQPRSLSQVVDILTSGGLVAYPTDSAFALGCVMGNRAGLDRIHAIRQLDRHHHFTLVCSEFAQLGTYVQMDNWMFRMVKSATPGPYTFILPDPGGAEGDAERPQEDGGCTGASAHHRARPA